MSIAFPPLELWGGVECTVNRVGEQFFDQLEQSGHAARPGDLELFALLGIRALRYPVLWERTAPNGLAQAKWAWADERLGRLRRLGVRPIVGLLHHGSGPATTSLIDPCFPEKLAEFAGAVAGRYPWVNEYTPINEPLTTARFSGLYGCWYPHESSDVSFARALVNQCRAIVLAMKAIRAVNPAAQLIQTEDLGKTFSTPALTYQAEFDNHRRWLGFDLLCGRMSRDHPLWDYLVWAQVGEDELKWFGDNACRPDVLGANYYPTSERFLDEHLERYPLKVQAGNEREGYADVAAVRVRVAGMAGAAALLRELWQAYQIPLAVTEVHLGCSREEQMRWLVEVWQAAEQVRGEGVEVRAVTAWSLLGAYDWNSLLTRWDGYYEPGVFDVRGPEPRPTALAAVLPQLAAGREPVHPVLDSIGWWRRPKRLVYEPVNDAGEVEKPKATVGRPKREARPLLILGAGGTLGYAFGRLCDHRGLQQCAYTRQELDISDAGAVAAIIKQWQPWAVINTAGYVRVDEAEADGERCSRANAHGPAVLAAACAGQGIPLLTFSSDLVFDGEQRIPYIESDPVRPLNEYGRSKAEAEKRVLAIQPAALIIRTSAFFGPWDEHNFVTSSLRTLAEGRRVWAAGDAVISPTYVPDLVHAALDLLIDGERGIWHLANEGAVTWAQLARQAAERAGYDSWCIIECRTGEMGLAAERPLYSVLGSERGMLLPTLERAMECYFKDFGA